MQVVVDKEDSFISLFDIVSISFLLSIYSIFRLKWKKLLADHTYISYLLIVFGQLFLLGLFLLWELIFEVFYHGVELVSDIGDFLIFFWVVIFYTKYEVAMHLVSFLSVES